MPDYKSNIKQVVVDLSQRTRRLAGEGIPKQYTLLTKLALDVLREHRERIHEEGLDINENRIKRSGYSTYSTKPMYANPSVTRISKLVPKGKTGKTTFKNGKPHKTRYLSQGYKELRRINGHDVSVVNLEMTGALKLGFGILARSKRSIQVGFLSTTQLEKAQGLEQHYKQKIWGFGKRERSNFEIIVKAHLQKYL